MLTETMKYIWSPDFVTSVLANLFTIFITALFAWVWYRVSLRRRLSSFFGLGKGKVIRIFIGHVHADDPPQGYVGFEESSAAYKLQTLFKSPLPGFSEWLKSIQVGDIDVEVIPGKNGDETVTLEHSAISIGARNSNYASKLIEDQPHCKIHFIENPLSIQIANLPPITSRSQCVIARIHIDHKSYFYVLGLTEPGTAVAARYLFRRWNSMRKENPGGTSFYYLIEGKDNRAGEEIVHGTFPH